MAASIVIDYQRFTQPKTKHCPSCDQDRPLDQFGRGRGKEGKRSYCKACCVAAERVRRNKDLDNIRAKEAERRLLNLPARREREKRAEAKRRTPEYLERCRKQATLALKAKHEQAGTVTKCVCCGVELCWLFGRQSTMKRCLSCSHDYAINYRRAKAAKRRALKRSTQVEHIDPIRVFERDGWRCHICKKKLKPEDRGTHKPTAPELDHIVTLADGGSHTWGNVACSCRACNMAKHSKSFGQIGLQIAA